MQNYRIVLRGSRIVIPYKLEETVIDLAHVGHQGIVKCRELANQHVWWPTVNAEIKQLCETCYFCEEHQLSK